MHRPLQQRSFLADQTNESDLQRPKDDPDPMVPQSPKSLRRTNSFQFGHSRISSTSISTSDENESILSAAATATATAAAVSTPDLSKTTSIPQEVSPLPKSPSSSLYATTYPLDDPLLSWLDLQRPRTSLARLSSPTKPHSRWPIKQLDTITEQRSIATLGQSASRSTLPRQASRPSITARVPEIAVPEHAPGSLPLDFQKSHSPSPVNSIKRPEAETIPQTPKPCHRRSFSLNDLDCLLKFRSSRRTHDKSSSQSSTSSASSFKCSLLFKDLCFCPASPVRPAHPPPVRVKTPPGLPSFGTKEAARYVNSSRHSRPRSNTPPVSRVSIPDNKSWLTSSPLPTSSLPISSTPTNVNSRVARLLNLLAFVTPEPLSLSHYSAPSSSSPPTIAPLPPEALRAADGTSVRGRFSSRRSGHGVGGGGPRWQGLESHPFHRAPTAELSSSPGADQEGRVGSQERERERRRRESWEPTGASGEAVMTGAIQDFLEANGSRATVEEVGQRMRRDEEEETRRQKERGWLGRCGRWVCLACCAWNLDDGTGALAGGTAMYSSGSGYTLGSRMVY